jgi:hypothetical protein
MPRISQLQNIYDALDGSEIFPLVQQGDTVKADIDNIIEYIRSITNTWDKAQSGSYEPLTSSSNIIAVDLSLSNNFNHTLTQNTTLAAPSNAIAGQAGIMEFKHGATPYLLSFNAFWKWSGGTVGVITNTINAVSVMSYVVSSDGTFATCVMLPDVK